MTNTDTTALLVADRAILTELAEQCERVQRIGNTVIGANNPVTQRKLKFAEGACTILIGVAASAGTDTRHAEAHAHAVDGDVDFIIDYFDGLAD